MKTKKKELQISWFFFMRFSDYDDDDDVPCMYVFTSCLRFKGVQVHTQYNWEIIVNLMYVVLCVYSGLVKGWSRL